MNRRKRSTRAFTLIEMMVVVAVIGILIAGVFRLMSATGESNKRARTLARMQRLQNALSGFYAEYGTYPPVGLHLGNDPYDTNLRDEFGQLVWSGSAKYDVKLLNAGAVAARSQPVSFEYPTPRSMDKLINTLFKGYQSVNDVLGPTAHTAPEYLWTEIKMFKFGMLSFLVPRVEVVAGGGIETGLNSDGSEADEPELGFFKSKQWMVNNGNAMRGIDKDTDEKKLRKALEAQRQLENRTVARWLPNLEGIIRGGNTYSGVDTREPEHDGIYFPNSGHGYTKGATGGGSKYLLRGMTVTDGWGGIMYYYSAPPYQSYRLWSGGPNGKTFPPWIPLTSLKNEDRKIVTTAIEDDLVRADDQ